MRWARIATILLICLPAHSSAGAFLSAQTQNTPAQCLNLVADGDSITLGFGATQPFPATISTQLGSTSFNHGIGSTGWNVEAGGVFGGSNSLIALAPANIDPKLTSLACANGAPPYLLLFAGLNDIRDGASPANAFATFQTYYNARIAAGWPANKILVATLLVNGITLAGQQSYNNALIGAGIYNLVRFDLDSNIGCATCNDGVANSTFVQSDNIHPTNAGLQIMAQLFCFAMRPQVGSCPAY